MGVCQGQRERSRPDKAVVIVTFGQVNYLFGIGDRPVIILHLNIGGSDKMVYNADLQSGILDLSGRFKG